uniref:Uncharacterized protein n=1 Tax=Anopheles atroparvus TaxID=41427 RepID=A0A182JI47_ANOAO
MEALRSTLRVDFSKLPRRPPAMEATTFAMTKLGLSNNNISSLRLKPTSSVIFIRTKEQSLALKTVEQHDGKHSIECDGKLFPIPISMIDNSVVSGPVPASAPTAPPSTTIVATSAPTVPTSAPTVPASAPTVPASAPTVPASAPTVPASAPTVPAVQTIPPSARTGAPIVLTDTPNGRSPAPSVPANASLVVSLIRASALNIPARSTSTKMDIGEYRSNADAELKFKAPRVPSPTPSSNSIHTGTSKRKTDELTDSDTSHKSTEEPAKRKVGRPARKTNANAARPTGVTDDEKQ